VFVGFAVFGFCGFWIFASFDVGFCIWCCCVLVFRLNGWYNTEFWWFTLSFDGVLDDVSLIFDYFL